MAKALKTVGMIVGAAALIATGVGAVAFGSIAALSVAGISTGALFLASSGLTLAAGLLQKGPSVPGSQAQRLIASVDPRAFRKTVLGQTAMATDIRYEEWSGKDQEYCDWIICLASHAIDGVEEIWIDQELAWAASRGVSAKFAGYFSVPNIILEGSPANAFTFGSGKWNGSTRLTGCAYLRLRFKTSPNGKKATSPFANGISTRLTIIGRGAKLYDPRRDSTVPGGSGPMRWNDQSTWRYRADDGVVIGENLALQILRVVLGWRIRNPVTGEMRLATGSGVPGRRIGLPSFQVAANLCDELVNRSAGGQEPRYHGAGVISEGDDPKTVLDMLCAACCGRFRDTNGKLELAIAHNDLAAAAADDGLNEDDVVGPFTWDPDPSLEATPNVIRGRYVDATAASLYQLIDYPEVRIASPDGQDRIATLDLGVVESPSQAQRVASQVLQRKQYQRAFTAPFDMRAWKYGVGDVVPFTFAPLGFRRALFRVADQEQGQGSTCVMTLTVEHQAIYAWDASDAAPVLAADPIIYDKGNNPLILAIGEAAETALWTAVEDNDPSRPRPQDGATVGAPNGTPVGDRLAEEINRLTVLNGSNFLGGVLRTDALAALVDVRTFINGEAIGTVMTRVQEQVTDGFTSFAQDFSMLAAKNTAGNGLILNAAGVYIDADRLLTTVVESLEQSSSEHDASITKIDEILFDASGATLRSMNVLNLDGAITGTVNTLTGEVGTYTIYADVFQIVNPNGGQPFSPFSIAEDGTVEMINVRVKTLAYEALVPLFGGPFNELTSTHTVQQLPGGLLRMTGKLRGSISSETQFNIVWPRPFPNACVARGAQVWNATYRTTADLWIENIGEPTQTGAVFATQAARGDVNVNIGGVDWWAEGY
ncbi:gp53-like domain-containing protein [Sphingomonas sp. Ag1]|uniref:gp53-like domain-containing protein n=1 Tax=Sphingomonas sp. Ag1 TaxID=1642949 RepID=UPI0006212C4D|nr:phage tail protein [Sphingomonas sp. Ag1]KKI17502.1 hypothetical protein XM50_14440 [Sphingomonas sp. Ag1]